jgi:hypothetical protein
VDAAVGGASHEAVTAHVDTNSALLAVRREGTAWMQLAGGLPLGSGGTSWGSFSGGTEMLSPGRFRAGVHAGGQGYLYSTEASSSDGWGAIGEAGPIFRYGWSAAEIEFRSGGIASRTVVDGNSHSRFLFSNAAEVGVLIPAGARVGAAAQYVRADGRGYPLLAATLSQAWSRGGWWARLGHWWTDEVENPEWSVGAYANAGQRFQLHALVRQETNDPIYLRYPRRSWSVGLSVVLGRRRAATPVAPIVLDGSLVTIRIPSSEAASPPAIAGDFNSWKPLPMVRDGEYWSASISVQPGIYRFSFRSDDGTWFLPPVIANRVEDGFGGEDGVLVVP